MLVPEKMALLLYAPPSHVSISFIVKRNNENFIIFCKSKEEKNKGKKRIINLKVDEVINTTP